jgi:hypothetical protein
LGAGLAAGTGPGVGGATKSGAGAGLDLLIDTAASGEEAAGVADGRALAGAGAGDPAGWAPAGRVEAAFVLLPGASEPYSANALAGCGGDWLIG